MRVGLIGSVGSSLVALKKLYEYNFEIVGVWGYKPINKNNVSGYCDLERFSMEKDLVFHSFEKVESCNLLKEVENAQPDILFVVGLSQIIPFSLIEIPHLGCVGFHPTKLPKGRGRAPMAWLVLEEKEGAATFFKIGKGVDDGPIYVQESFIINEEDDVSIVSKKLFTAMNKALDRWLPSLIQNNIDYEIQDEKYATYYARRAPLDGCIDWYQDASNIDRLIKAATNPHPGAFSFYEKFKVIIWKSSYIREGYPKGVVGRVVALTKANNPVIQCAEGYLIILDYEMYDYSNRKIDKRLVVGSRLGYYDHYEIFKMRNEIEKIKKTLEEIKNDK